MTMRKLIKSVLIKLRLLPEGPYDWYDKVYRGQVKVPVVKPVIMDSMAHDPEGFTQGLVCRDGFIYESTGWYGISSIRKMDTRGNILANVHLPDGFGEGIALYDEELVQLTWKEQVAVRYSLPQLDRLGTFSYEGEGWGLVYNGECFIFSNGSGLLIKRDNSFNPIGEIQVTLDGKPVNRLNDLEWVRGRIYANVWHAKFLLEIDGTSGKVVRIIDCTEMVNKEQQGHEDVLNGVAYYPEHDFFYLTGKNWRHIYVVKIPV